MLIKLHDLPTKTNGYKECLNQCSKDDACTHFTYNENNQDCMLFGMCPKLETGTSGVKVNNISFYKYNPSPELEVN